jgi:septal ring factor EnvC (AmiA/AmiB activator)
VVVLAHGEDSLTVYAHLARLEVKAGQEVARGDLLGAPGKLTPAGATGLSFELRFGAKPINPSRWLLAG